MNTDTPTLRERFRQTLDASTGVSELLADSNASYISWLETELASVTEQLKNTQAELLKMCLREQLHHEDYRAEKNRADEALLELASVTDQRDDILNIWTKHELETTEELARMEREQDRLAEALNQLATQPLSKEIHEDNYEHADWEFAYDEMIKISREALQSLNQHPRTQPPLCCKIGGKCNTRQTMNNTNQRDMSEEMRREEIALAMFSATLNAALQRSQNMLTANGARKIMESEMRSAWKLADMWIAQRPPNRYEQTP